MHANEMIRQKLDRKPRVDELRQRNDMELRQSQNYYMQAKSRSPTNKKR